MPAKRAAEKIGRTKISCSNFGSRARTHLTPHRSPRLRNMPFTPWSLGRRLRCALRRFRDYLAPDSERYPGITAALTALEEAIDAELPLWLPKRQQPHRPKADRSGQSRVLSNKVAYLRRKVAALRARTRRDARERCNRVATLYLTKVALAKPTTSARAFADSFRDLAGTGLCCRSTMAKIRDAFVPVVVDVSWTRLKAVLAAPGAVQQAAPCAGGPLVVSLLHIHDEASLRLRSAVSFEGAPSRSRSSCVQQHLLWAHVGEQRVYVPTELHALANKTAGVLATSLKVVVGEFAKRLSDCITAQRACIAAQSAGPSQQPWLVHLLVSDGLSTNELAARLLWAWVQRQGLHDFRYFLIAVKCGSHQANLAVSGAVTGRAALASAQNSAALCASSAPFERRQLLASDAASPHLTVCGVIVRLYKYLVSDYYEDFISSLSALVGRLRFVRSAEGVAVAGLRKWQQLAALYGAGVFPEGLLECLNAGFDVWEHHMPAAQRAGADASALERQEQSVRGKLLEILRRRLLVVDESPTLSRFFTFKTHVEGLLLLQFLGVWTSVLRCSNVTPREKNRRRLANVHAFFAKEDAPQYLRRTALAMQLPAHVSDICGQLGQEGDPLLVRLAKGSVRSVVSADLTRLVLSMHTDPDLDHSAFLTLALGTALDLVWRFQAYVEYPYLTCLLCRAYNSSWRIACLDFLQVPDSELDLGFSLQLKRLAFAAGESESARVNYLLSDSVQDALKCAFQASAASSLPVERAFAYMKRNEAPRLCHLASASRNQILRGFCRERDELVQRLALAEAALRRANKRNLHSLAWQQRSALVGRPLGVVAGLKRGRAGRAHQGDELNAFVQ